MIGSFGVVIGSFGVVIVLHRVKIYPQATAFAYPGRDPDKTSPSVY